jgi:CHASE1-domain containing sensor protein
MGEVVTISLKDLAILPSDSFEEAVRRSGLLMDLYQFFDSSERPITPSEFTRFWISLSREEKFDYLTLPLH